VVWCDVMWCSCGATNSENRTATERGGRDDERREGTQSATTPYLVALVGEEVPDAVVQLHALQALLPQHRVASDHHQVLQARHLSDSWVDGFHGLMGGWAEGFSRGRVGLWGVCMCVCVGLGRKAVASRSESGRWSHLEARLD
jgi:hypothetical protein